jgi:hypothetical protein
LGFELGTDVAFIANQHPLELVYEFRCHIALIDVSSRQGKAGNDAPCPNTQMSSKAVVGFLFGGAVGSIWLKPPYDYCLKLTMEFFML